MPTVNTTNGEVRLYCSNFRRLDMGLPSTANIIINLQGLTSSASSATLYPLDDQHLTPVATWISMGQ